MRDEKKLLHASLYFIKFFPGVVGNSMKGMACHCIVTMVDLLGGFVIITYPVPYIFNDVKYLSFVCNGCSTIQSTSNNIIRGINIFVFLCDYSMTDGYLQHDTTISVHCPIDCAPICYADTLEDNFH